MKKRKTYEISVIDKTYSNTISDETKFYTSDTALELGFELKETEYNFESAEIVLLNIDDRSLVTRSVAKNLDSFTYELDDDITAHFGDWRGQLRFEQAGEVYVSSPIKFRIENDLSNDRPPQLSDVQSWVNLKRYADSLTEELKQAVLSVEGIEDTFNENELERQNQFETAEQSRQTTFETNESERDETFSTNETARKSQELEREKAETARQTVFDDNEVNRAEMFNANEATRQENETTRQQAESQRQSTFETNEVERQTTFESNESERQSAEIIRVNAEEQRKIEHENRSVELASKADKFALNNLFENGDFTDGAKNINLSEGARIENQKLVYAHGTSGSTIRWFDKRLNTDMYYVHIKYNTDETSNAYKLVNNQGKIYPLNSSSNFHSHRLTYPFSANISIYGGQNATSDLVVDYYISLNLTEIFGESNEPSKEEMDELIKITGYINNEYALNNKEMLIWTLALIRRNKNAIISLGGTI